MTAITASEFLRGTIKPIKLDGQREISDRFCSRFHPNNFINSAEFREILWMTKIMSSVGFLAKFKYSSEFCGKWGIRVECTVDIQLIEAIIPMAMLVPYVGFCTGHFVMVPLGMTYLHCLQHSLFEHLFNLYLKTTVVLYRIQTHLVNPRRTLITSAQFSVNIVSSGWSFLLQKGSQGTLFLDVTLNVRNTRF